MTPLFRRLPSSVFAVFIFAAVTLYGATVPVAVEPVTGRKGMVVAGHPEAAEAGLAVLRSGGSAVDAAVAVSLALGVAEPYGSGLGGKLMLLHYDAATGVTLVVDAMDEASGSLDPAAYRKLGEKARYDGWTSVCVPGLAAGLHTAHQLWGRKPWAEVVAPAIDLARRGFTVLPKTSDLFAERLDKLRGGDPDIRRIFLPGDQIPVPGTKLPNEDLARTMELLARDGPDGFYRGPVAEAIVAASRSGGGSLTLDDLASYRARVTTPIGITFRGYSVFCAPPPATGGALALGMLKVLEQTPLQAPLRSAENLDQIGRVWRQVQPLVQRTIADGASGRVAFERIVSADSIQKIRNTIQKTDTEQKAAYWINSDVDLLQACTTHFAVIDGNGNIVCATQSQSLHFGAGVVAAGVVMNDSMSNFAFSDERSPNFVAPRRRPRSTITPTIVMKEGRPVMAVGVPGASRIPTAIFQTLVDVLVFDRPIEEAVGDTRVHWQNPLDPKRLDAIEAEATLGADVVTALRRLGWDVSLREPAGTGRTFGGINVISLSGDGEIRGYADPRRTNAARGF
jgi:gamma-glutamyltranspeptidase/glutathione hydrolase